MQVETLRRLLQDHLPTANITVNGDGRHFDAVIVSEDFNGKNTLKRQQMIYAFLNPYILDGTIHAISFKTYTAAEYANITGNKPD